MKAAIIGATFVDVKGFSFGPYAPTGTNIGSVQFVHGGVCRNVCEDFGRQGETARFVSMVDESALGREVYQRLDDLGIDLEWTLTTKDGMGMWLAILDDHGDLVGSVSKQPNFDALEAALDESGEAILGDCDFVVLEIDTSERIAARVLALAERLNKPVYVIVANMGVISRHPEYLKRVKCFICNEIEAGKLMGTDLTRLTAFEMLDALMTCVRRFEIPSMVITMGEDGSVYFDGETGEAGHCPSIATHMVDSTGAGDAFFAATVMALQRGMPLWKAVRSGTRLASATLACDQSCANYLPGLFE